MVRLDHYYRTGFYRDFNLPDLLITVNFTALNRTPGSFNYMRESTIYIFVGLTNITHDIVSSTLPISLIPGLHLYGRVVREIRQKFVKPAASSIGILAVSDSILHPCFFTET
jgi:hypothetical protein